MNMQGRENQLGFSEMNTLWSVWNLINCEEKEDLESMYILSLKKDI